MTERNKDLAATKTDNNTEDDVKSDRSRLVDIDERKELKPIKIPINNSDQLYVNQQNESDEKMNMLSPVVRPVSTSSKADRDGKRVLGSYTIGETIGVGSQGHSKIKLGFHVKTGQRVALKIMFPKADQKGSNATAANKLMREINVMKSINHSNVLKLIDHYMDADYPEVDGSFRKCIVIVQEYVPCGELFDYLMLTGPFGDLATRTYGHQLMDGLHAMHRRGFAHRDLKPENLLIDENYNLKIADLGLSRSFVDSEQVIRHMLTACGTKGYLAPEIIKKKPYTYKADLFSVGIILFITYCAFPPFQEAIETDWWWQHLSKGTLYLEKSKKHKAEGNMAKSKQYTKHGVEALQQFWNNHTKRMPIEQEFQELIVNMLHPTEERRFNHQQIRNHAWYNDKVMTKDEIVKFMSERIHQVARKRKNKRMQMMATKKRKRKSSKHGHTPWGNLKHFLQSQITIQFDQSEFDNIKKKIDPNDVFLDNIEFEKDAPRAGSKARFTTFVYPAQVAARLKCATQFFTGKNPVTETASDGNDPSPNAINARPKRIKTRRASVDAASLSVYPDKNLSIMNCLVTGGKLVEPNKVAIKFKQYVVGDLKNLNNPKHQTKWIVYISKLQGSSQAFVGAVEEILSCPMVAQIIDHFEDE